MSQFDVVRVPDTFAWGTHETGEAQDRLSAAVPPPDLTDHEAGARNYRPDPDLLLAVNTAIHLRAPLLVTGDPGTGKTELAWFLKHYFGVPLFPYTVRSTGTARDLHYDFDAVAYLRTAWLAQAGRRDDDPAAPKAATPTPARTDPDQDARMAHLIKGPLWQAFLCSHTGHCIVLIDEIDKAPRDFPNDLLQELDKLEFPHPFGAGPDDLIRADRARLPLVLVTSNNERRLPDAFLRRCIVHHIALNNQLVDRAVAAHGAAHQDLAPPLRRAAIACFWALHGQPGLSRKPGIAELLAWLVTLALDPPKPEGPRLDPKRLADLPHWHCLIKDQADLELLRQVRR